jgi:adenylyltransferase/sulfurtransferase
MTNQEIHTRFDRQIILPEFGFEAQQKLLNANVLIIGIGGLGCPAMQYLVGAGVSKIGIVDGDRISISNLHRQLLFSSSDIGKMKVDVAFEKLNSIDQHYALKHCQEIAAYNRQHFFSKKFFDQVIGGNQYLVFFQNKWTLVLEYSAK